MHADPTSRMSLRASVLSMIDRLELERAPISLRRVGPGDLAGDPALRGAIVMHLDLVFRSSVTASELMFTAATGIARIAEHPRLAGFPIGVSLALPADRLVGNRRELFDEAAPALARAEFLMVYALATTPASLGAGVRLLDAARQDARELGGEPRLIAFSPLTGLRARLIQMVDDAERWAREAAQVPQVDGAILRGELLDLLARATMPDIVVEPARSWLAAEAREFAAGAEYKVGNFHRARGGILIGVADGGDPKDSDAMWARAYFDYGPERGN